jgi:hypothetical protein
VSHDVAEVCLNAWSPCVQLRELLEAGGVLDWAGDAGGEAFGALFRTGGDSFFSLRDAQMSGEKAALAVSFAKDRDVEFFGSLLDRAISEGFYKMADALLEEHKFEADSDGNTLLMHATLNGWDFVVKHLAYLNGVDINAVNHGGQSAIQMAVDRVRTHTVEGVPPDLAVASLHRQTRQQSELHYPR